MAGSGGHLLVPKAMRLIRFAFEKTGRIIRDKLPQASRTLEAEVQPAYARVTQRQPVSRLAQIRQTQSRWYSSSHRINSTARHFSSKSGVNTKSSQTATHPFSRTAAAVRQFTGRAPFASTLRPNLTGGTLSRTAGGYSLGSGRVGGVRYFSHGPAAPAQVVQNVSQAVRAFWLSGQKARFDGANPRTGEKRFRAVSSAQEDARYVMDMSPVNAPGSYVDFKVTPTITAIGPLASIPRSPSAAACDYEIEQDTLNNATLMSNLSIDFARALKDLAAIMNDLKHLATLGDLPISLHDSTTLRVKFPGCDADTVDTLCSELGIRRGLVGQDEDFESDNGVEMALLFPYAPSELPSAASEVVEYFSHPAKRVKRDRVEWHEMLSPAQQLSAGFSHLSETSQSADAFEIIDDALGPNPWLSSPSGYSSLHPSEVQDEHVVRHLDMPPFGSGQAQSWNRPSGCRSGKGYEGIEGIYRFIEECDRAQS
ncbi:uncharacterized protein A1O9_12764 [Exophiala aquamarina CBS 119918]|uniref:Casein kinase II beta 2 subunit n=1 Tax=Exophiala aquamarina CBS 119918 TaxID=1182545 RepID=A0A072P698_9EURO|nr:uncharacterized protein A1O9_12764 [Exophiala aquamarina CBS 119918]KEF51150.1 hypothetical protein A1O9_12764 [Exophiala aquamarina CBS 119918]